MNFEHYLSIRLFRGKRSFSALIVRIAIAGIALGLSVMIVAVAVVAGFKHEIEEKITGFGGHVRITALQRNNVIETPPIHLTNEQYQELSAMPALSSIRPYAIKTGIIRSGTDLEGIALKGVDSTYDWNHLQGRLQSGRIPAFRDSSSSLEVLMSAYTADRLKLKAGDKFMMYFLGEPLRKRKYIVAGIFNSGIQELDKLYLLGDIRQIRQLNDWAKDEVGGYEIQCADPSAMDSLTVQINERLPQDQIAVSASELYPQLFEWLDLLDVNGEVIIVLMLLVAGINMISALLIIILERTNTIGLLKALGSTSGSIRKVFLYNAFYLILRGLLLGNLFGLSFCLIQQHWHVVQLDEASYYMAYAPVLIKPMYVLLLNVGTLLACLLMLVLPSMLVYRIQPVKAIRFQ